MAFSQYLNFKDQDRRCSNSKPSAEGREGRGDTEGLEAHAGLPE